MTKDRKLRILGPINKILYLYFLKKIKKAKKADKKYYIIKQSESCPTPVANQLITDGYKLYLEPSNPDFTRVKVCLGNPKKYAPNGSRIKKSIKQK